MFTIDADRFLADLRRLAQFGSDTNGGVTRIAYSDIDMKARDWVDAELRTLGMSTRRDAAGNSIARLDGTAHTRVLALGSHTDTVPNGGRFDGALGVMAAVAVARALQEHGVRLQHALEVINFMAEEATMSGGTTGSQMLCGLFNPIQLQQQAWDGQRVGDHLRRAGLVPERWREAIRPSEDFAAFVELHIEQGDALLTAQRQLAAVEGLVGIRRYRAVFAGAANHAGTTSMQRRDDALVKAAPFVTAVREIAIAHGIIGTVGSLQVLPGAPNVIPGRVEMIVELRALRSATLDQAGARLAEQAADCGGVLERTVDKAPVACGDAVITAIENAAAVLDVTLLRMPSGAFHDAANMASLCPAGMLFVPSQGGISHSPDEFSTDADCVAGANALLHTVLRLDTTLN
jgi:N-carbamoyl-L-amino-acid hydrolase